MTSENYQRAQILAYNIDHLKKQIDIWSNCTALDSVRVISKGHGSTYADKNSIDLDMLKRITLLQLRKELNTINAEFETL